MSDQGQGLLSHYYIGFVCFVLILGPDISRAFTGPLVLWFYFSIFLWPFSVTIATTKLKSILNQITLIIQLMKHLKENDVQKLSFLFSEGGGQKTGFMHVLLYDWSLKTLSHRYYWQNDAAFQFPLA